LRLEVDIPQNLERLMADEIAAGERAVTRGIGAAGRQLKEDWRGQIRRAGLGPRLARTIRARVFPERDASLRAAALVWSRAPQIVDAFDRGALIRSRAGFYLTVPLPAAGTRGAGGRRITPGGWERRTGLRLRFVYRRRGPSLLVAEDARVSARGIAAAKRGRRRRDGVLTGASTVSIFLLMPQVKLRKRLDLERAARAVEARLPALILASWKDAPS
jgi:hypothetical protein